MTESQQPCTTVSSGSGGSIAVRPETGASAESNLLPARLTPDQRAQAATVVEAWAEAGTRPLTSRHGGHVIHAEHVTRGEFAGLPHCRASGGAARHRKRGSSGQSLDNWREASIREMADLPLCGQCRKWVARRMDEA